MVQLLKTKIGVSVYDICILLHICNRKRTYTRDAFSMNNIWSFIFIFVFIYCREEFIFKTLPSLQNGYLVV